MNRCELLAAMRVLDRHRVSGTMEREHLVDPGTYSSRVFGEASRRATFALECRRSERARPVRVRG
jgi:hypothetical protein